MRLTSLLNRGLTSGPYRPLNEVPITLIQKMPDVCFTYASMEFKKPSSVVSLLTPYACAPPRTCVPSAVGREQHRRRHRHRPREDGLARPADTSKTTHAPGGQEQLHAAVSRRPPDSSLWSASPFSERYTHATERASPPRRSEGGRPHLHQVRFCRYRFCATGELKYRGAVG
jgi:hypothetical protein